MDTGSVAATPERAHAFGDDDTGHESETFAEGALSAFLTSLLAALLATAPAQDPEPQARAVLVPIKGMLSESHLYSIRRGICKGLTFIPGLPPDYFE